MANQAAQQAPVVPFASAAHEYTERMFDSTKTPGSSTQQLGPYDVPSYGYLRHLVLQIDGSGGNLDGGTADEDFPFNLIESIQLADVNGAPIFGPMNGWELLQCNLYGGYMTRDPRDLSDYDSGFASPNFTLRIPIEVSHRDGFGALANQHSGAQYKLYITLADSSTIVSGGTAPTAPECRIRGWLEAWTLPDETDMVGRPQADVPPMVGTTMFHSQIVTDVQVGENTKPLLKVGNLIRAIIVVSRTTGGARSDDVFADPVRMTWDGRTIKQESQIINRLHSEGALPAAHSRDTGVHAFLFNTSIKNSVGDDSPQLWLPTVQSTRMELNGEVGTAGTWKIITCDIAPAEVSPSERYVQTSLTGHQPQGTGAGVNSGRGNG